jgi:hypothetical protein
MRPHKQLKNSLLFVLLLPLFSFNAEQKPNVATENLVRISALTALFFTAPEFFFQNPTNDADEEAAELGVRSYLGDERYAYMLQINPGLIADLKLRFRFGVRLMDWNIEKASNHKILSKITLLFKDANQEIASEMFVQLFESGEINPLRIDLPVHHSQQSFFILANTGKALVMNSWEQMRTQYQLSQQ